MKATSQAVALSPTRSTTTKVALPSGSATVDASANWIVASRGTEQTDV